MIDTVFLGISSNPCNKYFFLLFFRKGPSVYAGDHIKGQHVIDGNPKQSQLTVPILCNGTTRSTGRFTG